jgi:hypothetical protein
MTPEPSVLTEFGEGETRLVYARWRDGTPGLRYLAEGTADATRQLTRDELLCPIVGCPTPALTTVNGGTRARDHFRHHTANDADHPGESLLNVEGKAQIALWAAGRYPGARVQLEEASSDAWERVADVMVTLVNGKRIAIKVQYASLQPEKWQTWHDSYVNQGIRDVWLFGHTGNHLTRLPDGRIRLNPTLERVAATGMPVLWFNPIKLLIGTATRTVSVRSHSLEILALEHADTFTATPLNAHDLTHTAGLTNESLAALVTSTKRYGVWLTQERLLETQRANNAAERARVKAKRAAATRTERLRVYLESAEAVATLRRFGGTWPTFLQVELSDELTTPAEIWQAHFFLTMMDTERTGVWIRRDLIAAAYIDRFQPHLDQRKALVAVSRWLGALVDAQILRVLERTRNGKRSIIYYRGARPIVAAPPAVAGPTVPVAREDSSGEWIVGLSGRREAIPSDPAGRPRD